MAKRGKIDWEAAHAIYRTGKFSNRELGEKVGCSEAAVRKRAKTRGWEKDLSELVKEKVRTKQVRSKVRTLTANDLDTVEQAAQHDFNIVKSHCKIINKSRNVTERLIAELESTTAQQEDLIKVVESSDVKKKDFLLKMVGLPERARTLTQLVTALGRLVDLERQAYNIGDTPSEDSRNIRKIELVALSK